MELSLSQAFGANASQSIDSLIISKTDLSLLGAVNNTADSLVVAIILQLLDNFQGNLTDNNNDIVVDNNNISVTYDNSNYWDNIGLNYWGKTLPNGLIRYVFLFHEYQIYTSS